MFTQNLMYALLLFYIIIFVYFCQFLCIVLRPLLILSVNPGSTGRYYIRVIKVEGGLSLVGTFSGDTP